VVRPETAVSGLWVVKSVERLLHCAGHFPLFDAAFTIATIPA